MSNANGSGERPSLLRWLYLVRKTFFTKFWQTHYSQWGEDVVLDFYLRHAPPPAESFYIDVGCYHPKKHSNTYRLHRAGWRGINVDVDPIKIDAFRLARPGDENVCCAVGDTPGRATLYQFGFYSLGNTLDRATAELMIAEGQKCREIEVEVRTLTNIIDASPFRERRPALLNIDVEGHEEAVLRSLDFGRYRPTVILAEFHRTTLPVLMRDRRFRLLTEDLNYEMVNWLGLTVVFVDRAWRKWELSEEE